MDVDQIVEEMIALSKEVENKDKVVCLFAICMRVTKKIVKVMEEMNSEDKRRNN